MLGIHKFSFKSKERIRSEKAYVIDSAFVSERAETIVGANFGWRLENIVYIELLRRTRPLFEDVFYFRNNLYEIDFVVCRNNTVKELIQVSVDISSDKTFKREISALQKGAVELKCNNLTLITLNGSRQADTGMPEIRVVPAIDWLLQES